MKRINSIEVPLHLLGGIFKSSLVNDLNLDGDLMSNSLIVNIGDTKVDIVEMNFILVHGCGFLDLDGDIDGEISLWLDFLEGDSDLLKD